MRKIEKPLYKSSNSSFFQLNHGYTVRGRASYDSLYWAQREKSLPPYEDKEKLFADLSAFRPIEQQFADFHHRSDTVAQRMYRLYQYDPYIRRLLEERLSHLKSVSELFNPAVDY